MISFREQVILIIYFIIYGLFLGASYDILHFYLERLKFKLIISYIIQTIFWGFMVVISCLYMLKVSKGYLTIYTFLFFTLGIALHFILFSKQFRKTINSISNIFLKIYNKVRKAIIIIVFPKEVINFLKRLFNIRKIYSKIKNKIIKRNKGGNNDESQESNHINNSNVDPRSNEWLF